MGFALMWIVAYRLQGLSRNKTSEGLQSSRNGMTSYGLITEMRSFFMNAWPARGVGMLSSYRGFKACDSYANGEEAITQVTCPVLFVLGAQAR